jgi:hypothetical protein
MYSTTLSGTRSEPRVSRRRRTGPKEQQEAVESRHHVSRGARARTAVLSARSRSATGSTPAATTSAAVCAGTTVPGRQRQGFRDGGQESQGKQEEATYMWVQGYSRHSRDRDFLTGYSFLSAIIQ